MEVGKRISSKKNNRNETPQNIDDAAKIVSQLEKNRSKVVEFGTNAKRLAFKT